MVCVLRCAGFIVFIRLLSLSWKGVYVLGEGEFE